MFYHVLLYHVFPRFTNDYSCCIDTSQVKFPCGLGVAIHHGRGSLAAIWPLTKARRLPRTRGTLGGKVVPVQVPLVRLESVGMWMWGCDVDHKNGRWEGFLVSRVRIWKIWVLKDVWITLFFLEDWKNKHQGDVYIKMFAWIYLTREELAVLWQVQPMA